ncbi:MAG: hypothetical protein CMK83_03740 [Pseudomonadales bacterium]|nr:hypothetical protein [Pseudomonadales bacterium]MCK5791226.1 AAA family ATPase [Ketobacter sp.]TNC89797.1 MAG: hypothetical protein CSH49_05865 [Alcanivorax sp.]HAG94174.1 hypothetical protein [Gammaproteobacteria bacterium]MBI27607.1 hypothetical protein [Pseudomonadales bacterium]|tara:strand:- start:4891 stop:7572 length:2682 start_codon:yes stop_codon:yes gene_type:complete
MSDVCAPGDNEASGKRSSNNLLRPQLIDLVNRAEDYRLTVLLAPAGSGKSTLLRQWLRSGRQNTRFAVLNLEPRHHSPAPFFSSLIKTIKQSCAQFDAYYLNQINDSVEFSVEAVTESLAQGLARLREPLFVVLDDYQLIQDDNIHRTLSQVIFTLPPHIHFVVASRSHPPLQLSRLKLEDSLLSIDANDLKWDLEALENWFRSVGLATADKAFMQDLLDWTEGWIAGIKLMALSLKGGGADQSDHMAQESKSPEVLQYFADSVLAQQPDDIRRFLIKTACLETLDATLCNDVLQIDNAQRCIDYLMENHVFLHPVDGQPDVYRYHSIFREFLLYRLRADYPQEIDSLTRRAASTLLERKECVQALELLADIDDGEALESAIVRCSDQWIKTGEFTRLIEWIDRLPEERIINQSELVYPLITALIFYRRFNQAEYYIELVQELNRRGEMQGRYANDDSVSFLLNVLELFHNDTEFRRNDIYRMPNQQNVQHHVRLFYSPMRAYYYLLNADFKTAVSEAYRARDILRISGQNFLRSFADLVLILAERAQGNVPSAVQVAEEAFRSVSDRPYTLEWVNLATPISIIRYEQNRLDEAEKLLREVVPMLSSACATEVITASYCALARLAFIRGNDGEAKRLLNYLARVLLHGDYERFNTQLCLEWTLYARSHGDLETMNWVQQEYQLEQKQRAGYWGSDARYDEGVDRLGVSRVIFLIMTKKFDQAEALCGHLIRSAERHGCVSRAVVSRMNRALVYWHQGNEEQALQEVKMSVKCGGLVCLSRTLFDEAPGSAMLLMKAVNSNVINPLPESYRLMFCDVLQEDSADQMNRFVVEQLTEKEKEVLTLLQSGLRNKDVAQRANISLTTAKWHLKNVYAKLNVGNRTEAVAKAREMNLL